VARALGSGVNDPEFKLWQRSSQASVTLPEQALSDEIR